MTPRLQINQAKLQEAFRKLRAAPEDIRRTNESLMRQMAGVAGVELANATNPPFFAQNSDGIAGFRIRVKGDITRAQPYASALYQKVYINKGKPLADAYWQILSQQGKNAAMIFLQSIGISSRIAEFSSSYVQSKRAKKGRVPDNVFPLFIPEEEEAISAAYVAKKQANVGFAKAGWLTATNAITRSRAGGGAIAWVRKLANKASGTGTMTQGANGIRITLKNTVPHASDAMNGGLMVKVPKNLYSRMESSIKRQLKYVLKKL